jgi:hypothetical protein
MEEGRMAEDDLVELELMRNRFKRLVGEVARGVLARNTFQPWEIEILLDMEKCPLNGRRRLDILRQWERAVERQMATGPGPPMKLSEYLAERRAGEDPQAEVSSNTRLPTMR